MLKPPPKYIPLGWLVTWQDDAGANQVGELLHYTGVFALVQWRIGVNVVVAHYLEAARLSPLLMQ